MGCASLSASIVIFLAPIAALVRNPPERLVTMDLDRWKDTTPEAINKWFDAYQELHQIHNFEPHNIYNMDEMGFAIGTSQYSRVVVDTTLRTRYKVEPS